MKIKLKMNTWIDFPFIAKTTSPGFVALPLGKFSVNGINPKKKKISLFSVTCEEIKSRINLLLLLFYLHKREEEAVTIIILGYWWWLDYCWLINYFCKVIYTLR